MHSPRTSNLPAEALPPKRTHARTCVGCGEEAAPDDLVRLVLDEDKVVVDAAGGSFGRGAHVHPQPDCLAKAERGLSKSFKRAIKAPPSELATALVAALTRRAESLLGTASRLHKLQVGADAVLAALAAGSPLVVVACDAGSIAQTHEVTAAVSAGQAVAWSTRAHLGNLLNRNEVAILAMEDTRLANAFAATIHTMSALSPVTEVTASAPLPAQRARTGPMNGAPAATPSKGEECKSPEVR